MLWRMKEDTLRLADGTLDYAAFGRGTRPLVIIPGLSLRDVKGAGAGLAWMYRRFAKDYRVYVLDKKSNIPAGYTVRDIANDTSAAMRQLGISHACVLGVSLGGMVAQYLAIEYPDLVGCLVLGVTASRVNDTLSAVIDQWVSLAERDDFGSIVRGMTEIMYSAAYVKRYRWLFPLLEKLGTPKNKERFIHLAYACLTCDTYGSLDRIGCRTLILGGCEDKIVTGAASMEMAARIGCEIHMYEGLGHAAYEEARDFNQRIYDFFANVDGDERVEE